MQCNRVRSTMEEKAQQLIKRLGEAVGDIALFVYSDLSSEEIEKIGEKIFSRDAEILEKFRSLPSGGKKALILSHYVTSGTALGLASLRGSVDDLWVKAILFIIGTHMIETVFPGLEHMTVRDLFNLVFSSLVKSR